MAYALQVDDRNAADVATIGALRELRYAVRAVDAPELQHLLDHGWSDDVPALRADLAKLSGSRVWHTALAFLAATEGSPEAVSLTDGLGE